MWKYLLGLVGIIVSIKLYFIHTTGWCKNKVSLIGKTVIVTGANSGIGYEAALEFAKRGAKVILACRNKEKAEHAREKIVKLTKNPNVHVKLINMASLKSVKDFASDILQNEDRLDILVNNAGVAGIRNKNTDDGLQILMQVNYFSAVLLTLLLLDLLKKTAPSRIVNVSSTMASTAKLDAKDLNKYAGHNTYANTKLCNILFTKELAKRLRNTEVAVYSLHPGGINTDIFNKLRGWREFAYKILRFYFKTPEAGAQTTIYVATQSGIENYSGYHFEECSVVSDYKIAKDPEMAKTVWEKTIELLGIKDNL